MNTGEDRCALSPASSDTALQAVSQPDVLGMKHGLHHRLNAKVSLSFIGILSPYKSTDMCLELENTLLEGTRCLPDIKAPENGDVTCTNSKDQFQRCRFTCKPSYYVRGLPLTTCLPNGKWSVSAPSCVCRFSNRFYVERYFFI